MKYKLLPKQIKDKLPKLYEQEDAKDPIVHVKLFLDSWTWFITEGSPDENGSDYRLFGLVYGFEEEFGYVMLSELETVKNKMGLGVERDLFFQPKPLSEAKAEYLKQRGQE